MPDSESVIQPSVGWRDVLKRSIYEILHAMRLAYLGVPNAFIYVYARDARINFVQEVDDRNLI